MSNYTKTTNFAAKDSLPSGNAAKIVKGTEIDTEFNNIATASATKANTNNAALTGTTTFETISDGTIAITAFVDEDNMASDSATLLPTQQSVKAYVDSQVTAQDLDVTDGSTSIDIDLDSESLGILGGTGIDSTASGTGVTLAIDSTVATLTGSQTLSNKTLSTPVVSGNLTTDGLLDGRDVAADGTKLDGIESGATADQTAAEIKTAYESNANTNAFTDADESKLDGIEASADVTDTANVTAAGALMDSELTSEASVKALNQGVATTDSPTFAGVTAPVTGNVTGNLTGNVTGNVTGDVTGDLTGDVTGNVTGNLTGSVLTAAQTNITSVGTLGSLTVSGDVTVDTNTLKVDSTNNRVGLLNASPDVTLDVGSATDAVHVPTGTTAQRPTGAAGYFRYNSTLEQFEGYTDAWGAIGGGGGSNLVSDTMTGDGVDTTLTLSNDPLNENNTQVYIDGVYQNKDTYSVSGTTLTFSTAPPSGSAVEAMTIQPTAVNVPADASVTSAKLSGDLTLPGDLSFADNNKAIFGAGSDLQIYHDGSNSIIHETAAGSLILRGTNLNLQTDANVNYLQAVANGAVTLYHQSGGASAPKLATTATGIDVTGSISASGNVELKGGQELRVYRGDNATYGSIKYLTGSGGLQLNDKNGDGISFVKADGATEYGRFDASGNLLVNRTSVFTTAKMEIQSDAGDASTLALNSINTDGSILEFYKAGNAVGSINNFSSTEFGLVSEKNLVLTQNTTTERNLVFSSSYFGSFGVDDATIDLGRSVGRFKDLYLSGGVKANNGLIGTSTPLGSSIFTVHSNNAQGLAIGYGTGTNEYRRLYHHSSGLYFESSTNQAYLSAAGAWTNASDVTLKKDIEDIDYGLETIKSLTPRKYKMKSDDEAQIGFIAQELAEQVPEIVGGKEGLLGVSYGQLTAVLTKAIQEQQETIEAQAAAITDLTTRLTALENN